MEKNYSRINEKKHRLKFFYFIPIDDLVEDLKAVSDREYLFLKIFEKITYAGYLYNDYILAKGESPGEQKCFFSSGKNINDIQTTRLFMLSGIALFHHCLLHGYEQALRFDERISELSPLRMTYKNDRFKKGYFQCVKESIENDEEETDQRYNSRYKYFMKDSDEFYSKKILKNLRRNNPEEKALEIHPVQFNPALFLFKQRKIKTLSRQLQNSNASRKTIVETYRAASECAIEWKTELYGQDAVLFDALIETHYSFILSPYICNLLSEISLSDAGSRKKMFDNQTFYDLINHYVYSMPIIYNRSVFLQYAWKSILCSDNLNPIYPWPPNSSGKIATSSEEAFDTYSSKGIQLIGRYFRMLQYVTLPLLEDLWDVFAYELDINLEDYCTYINAHYEMIAYDYTLLSDQDVFEQEDLTVPSLDFSGNYKRLQKYIKKNKVNTKKVMYSPYDKLDNHLVNQVYAFIKNQCSYNEKRTAQSLLDEMIASYADNPVNSSSNGKAKEGDYEIAMFQYTHFKNIFDFVCTLPHATLSED